MEEVTQMTQATEIMDALIRAGWLSALTMENRDMALQNLIQYEALTKRREAMDQFCKGLKTLGIHSAIQASPEVMKGYFIQQPSQLTALKVLGLFGNVNLVQECEAERARGFLVESIHSLEEGILRMTLVHSKVNNALITGYIQF